MVPPGASLHIYMCVQIDLLPLHAVHASSCASMPSQAIEHWYGENHGGRSALMPSYRKPSAIKRWLDEQRAKGAIRSSPPPSEGALHAPCLVDLA